MTFNHELGHNSGLAHNHENAGSSGFKEYGYGYRNCSTGGFRTIMSYSCGTPRVNHYSSTVNTYNG